MSRVLATHLNVRAGPSTNTAIVAYYDPGQIINSGEEIIFNEGRYWLKYTGGSGNKRFVCAYDLNGSKFVEVPPNVPGPRPEKKDDRRGGETGIPGIPKQYITPILSLVLIQFIKS